MKGEKLKKWKEKYPEYDPHLENTFLDNLLENQDGDLFGVLSLDSVVKVADGCEVESNGICIHGYRSPMLVLGVI